MRHRKWGFAAGRLLKRTWIPIVIVTVIVAGGLTVGRLHGIFGSERRPAYADTKINDNKPFEPKRITYEVFGAPGTVADISYFDTDANPPGGLKRYTCRGRSFSRQRSRRLWGISWRRAIPTALAAAF